MVFREQVSGVKKLMLVILLLAGVGCYQDSRYEPSADRSAVGAGDTGISRPGTGAAPVTATVKVGQRFPWETWALGRDLNGQPLTNLSLLTGDDLTRQGQRDAALKKYEEAVSGPVSTVEKEAAVLRVVSSQLALRQPRGALNTLSSYFNSRGSLVEDVDARASLLFAYAYGGAGDIEQSLAWFSRVNRLSSSGGIKMGAASGVRSLLAALPDDKFYPLASIWSTDSFIKSIFGQESRQRSVSGAHRGAVDIQAFWEQSEGGGAWEDGVSSSAGEVKIGVLLPLTGEYAPLGQETKKGLELAFAAQGGGVKVLYRDTTGSPLLANAALEELAANGGIDLVLGPLLTQPAEAVADLARRKELPVITLSKKSVFPTGYGVFRLGPTTLSLMHSLAQVAIQSAQFSKIGMLYPADAAHQELADAFKEELRLANLQPVYEQTYLGSESSSFSALAPAIETQSMDALFFPDDLNSASKFLLSISEARRRDLVLLGPPKWCQLPELLRSWKVMEGAVFVCPFFDSSKREYVARFVTAFQQKYGAKPDFMAAQGFDLATLTLGAIERQRQERLSFRAALESIAAYDGLTGRMEIDPSGEILRTFSVLRVRPQGLEELIPTAPGAIAPAANEIQGW